MPDSSHDDEGRARVAARLHDLAAAWGALQAATQELSKCGGEISEQPQIDESHVRFQKVQAKLFTCREVLVYALMQWMPGYEKFAEHIGERNPIKVRDTLMNADTGWVIQKLRKLLSEAERLRSDREEPASGTGVQTESAPAVSPGDSYPPNENARRELARWLEPVVKDKGYKVVTQDIGIAPKTLRRVLDARPVKRKTWAAVRNYRERMEKPDPPQT